jgi:hypothetical protein
MAACRISSARRWNGQESNLHLHRERGNILAAVLHLHHRPQVPPIFIIMSMRTLHTVARIEKYLAFFCVSGFRKDGSNILVRYD